MLEFGMLIINGCFVNIETVIHMKFREDTEKLVDNWTYPLIQPKLIEEAHKRGYI
jgi:8-oxo-dGTP diphosphatase